jgi:hypothetical protein
MVNNYKGERTGSVQNKTEANIEITQPNMIEDELLVMHAPSLEEVEAMIKKEQDGKNTASRITENLNRKFSLI